MVPRDSSDNYTTWVIHTASLMLSTYLDNQIQQTPQHRCFHFLRHHLDEGLCGLLEMVKRWVQEQYDMPWSILLVRILLKQTIELGTEALHVLHFESPISVDRFELLVAFGQRSFP